MSAIKLRSALKWTALAVAAPLALAALLIALFGWNWLRGPIERAVTERTGRALVINGDLKLRFGWPRPRLQAHGVAFANPDWAVEKQMLTAEIVEVEIDLPQLLARNVFLPVVRLLRPVIFLEQGSAGRKNWLLDTQQRDEDARVRIGRLMLDRGTLGYDDVAAKTRVRAELATANAASAGAAEGAVSFSAAGQYLGLALKASGSGGPVLALRDERTPYPIKLDASIGKTGVKAEGTVTSLLRFSAVDLRLALSGESLDQLFPLIGIALPATRSYVTEGHLLHSGQTWRYEGFTGRVGDSDLAGSVEVETGGKRPRLKGELVSSLLDIADLGPLIGARPGSVAQAKRVAAPQAVPAPARPAAASGHVLPDLPFSTDRWDSVDAEVGLRAKSIRRAAELPLENLVVHLSLKDSVLTLDPLDLGVAGGHLKAAITLDGRADPIRAGARLRAKGILMAKLFPAVGLSKSGIGQVNGEFDLTGRGNSVGRMLATSNGKLGLTVAGGEISKLMMEKIGLHLWEMLEIKMTGDRLVKLRCAVADFDVKEGDMQVDALVFDTEVTTIVGTGSIHLGRETLNLILNQKTKSTSPLALRSPILVRGTFANPDIGVDKTGVAMRALGAVALGLINPLFALIPLIDAGPGKDSDCRQLVRDARALPHAAGKKAGRPK